MNAKKLKKQYKAFKKELAKGDLDWDLVDRIVKGGHEGLPYGQKAVRIEVGAESYTELKHIQYLDCLLERYEIGFTPAHTRIGGNIEWPAPLPETSRDIYFRFYFEGDKLEECLKENLEETQYIKGLFEENMVLYTRP